jgi:putative spermidine/putrescine transport system permease protein
VAVVEQTQDWADKLIGADDTGAADAARGRTTALLFLLPALAIVGILAWGLAMLVDSSLRELDRDTFQLSDHYTLHNYIEIFSRNLYLDVLLRSLLGAVLVTAFTLFLAFPYAYAMVRTRHAALRKLLLLSLFLPFFIGQVVRAYGWLVVLGKQGMINNLLGAFGLGPFNMLYNFPSVVLGLVQYMLPFAVLLLAPALVSIDEDLEAASESLGANWLRTFLHLVLPLAMPGLVAAGVVVFTISLTDFAMPEIMGGGKSDFMANLIYAAFFNLADSGLGSALSVVLVLLGSTVFAAVYALAGRRVAMRGML